MEEREARKKQLQLEVEQLKHFLLNITLIWTPLREAALAWSTSTCAMIQVVALLSLSRRHVATPAPRDVRRSWAKSIVLTAVMSAAIVPLAWWLIRPDMSWIDSFVALAVLTAAGGGVLLAGAHLLRMPETRWTLGRDDAGPDAAPPVP